MVTRSVASVLVAVVTLVGCGSATEQASQVSQTGQKSQSPSPQASANQQKSEGENEANPIEPSDLRSVEEMFLSRYPKVVLSGASSKDEKKFRDDLVLLATHYDEVGEKLKALGATSVGVEIDVQKPVATLQAISGRLRKASEETEFLKAILAWFNVELIQSQCALVETMQVLEDLGGSSVKEFATRAGQDQWPGFASAAELCSLPFEQGFPRLLETSNVQRLAPKSLEPDLVQRYAGQSQRLIAISPMLYVPWDDATPIWKYIQVGPWLGRCDEYLSWSTMIKHQPIGDDGICW